MSIFIFSAIILLNIMAWRVYESRILDRLIILCIWTAIIIWYCIPGSIAGVLLEDTPFTPFYFYKSNVTTTTWLHDFTITFILESSAVCCILAVLLFRHNAKKSGLKQQNIQDFKLDYNLNDIPSSYKIAILVITGATFGYQIINLQNYIDYLANNSADLYGSSNILSQIVTFIKPIVYSMTVLIAIYEKKQLMFMRIAFGEIIFDSILATMIGARIYMLTPIIIFIFRVLTSKNIQPDRNLDPSKDFNSDDIPTTFINSQHSYNKRIQQKNAIRLVTTFLATLLFLVYIFLPIARSIADYRANGEFNLYDIIVSTFTERKQTTDGSNKRMEDVEAVFGKLDSFTNGSILTSVSGYGTAGIMPYVGSALVFIPRFILPERPVAGSSDGSIYNHPSRLVPSSIGVQSDSLNVPSSPLSITFWHFGYPGFIMFVIVTFLYLKYLNYLASSPYFIYKSLAIFSINIPAFSTVFASPDVVLKNCILLVVLTYFVRFLHKLTLKQN